jgi:hypothetical protein
MASAVGSSKSMKFSDLRVLTDDEAYEYIGKGKVGFDPDPYEGPRFNAEGEQAKTFLETYVGDTAFMKIMYCIWWKFGD